MCFFYFFIFLFYFSSRTNVPVANYSETSIPRVCREHYDRAYVFLHPENCKERKKQT